MNVVNSIYSQVLFNVLFKYWMDNPSNMRTSTLAMLLILLVSIGLNIYFASNQIIGEAGQTTTFSMTIEKTKTLTITTLETTRITESPYPLKIIDFMKRDITIDKQPQRIVSCAPSITEILAALELTEYIVGVDEYSDYPPEIKRFREEGIIENVGGVTTLNIEKILALRPDIVFVSPGVQGGIVPILEEKGLTVVALDASTVNDVYKEILIVGKIMNIEYKALSLGNSIRDRIDYVQSKITQVKSKTSVLSVIWLEPIWTAGNSTFLNDIIGYAGGYNVLVDSNGWFMTNPETIVTRNPEVIIVTAMSIGMKPEEVMEKLMSIPGFSSVNAVKNNRVYLLYGQAENVFLRPGPRIGEAVELLAKILYPEIFNVEIPRTIDEEYTKYLFTISILA